MRNLTISLLFLLACSVAHSAPPSTESLDTWFEIAGFRESIDQSIYGLTLNMKKATEPIITNPSLSPEQRLVLAAALEEKIKLFREEMTWENLRPYYLKAYQENFTQEEIDGIVAFNRSVIGSAFRKKIPLVMQQTNDLLQERIKPFSEKLKAATQRAVIEALIAK